jgi:hypothetical protein
MTEVGGLLTGFFDSAIGRAHPEELVALALLCHASAPLPQMYESFHSTIADAIKDVEDWDGLYQTLLDVTSDCARSRISGLAREDESLRDELTAALNLLAFKGAFYKLAVEGSRIIVDEYTLPNAFKTIQPVVRPETVEDENEDKDLIGREVFAFAGLEFS